MNSSEGEIRFLIGDKMDGKWMLSDWDMCLE